MIMETLTVGPLKCRQNYRRGSRGDKKYWRIWKGKKSIWHGWATEEEVQREAGRLLNFHGFIDERTVPLTVGDLLKLWKADYQKRSDISERTKGTSFNALIHLLKHLGDQKLDQVVQGAPKSQEVLDNYRNARLSEDAAPASLHLEYRRLKQAWIFGQGRNWVRGSIPALTINWYSKNNNYTPTDQEVEKVISFSEGWVKTFLMVSYLMGSRLSEGGSLTWDQINLEGRTITFQRKRSSGKGKRTKDLQLQTVPIPDRLVEYLSTLPRNSETLLATHARSARGTIGREMKKLCVMAGVPVFTPHGLRRATVRRLRRNGVSIVEAAELLSNSPAVIWAHYEEVSPEELREMMDRVYPSGESKRESFETTPPQENGLSSDELLEELLNNYRHSSDKILHAGVQPAAVHRVPAGVPGDRESMSESIVRAAPAVPEQRASTSEDPWIDWSKA